MRNSKKIYDEYIVRKKSIEKYLHLKIKNDYDDGFDFSFFKVKGGWLDEPCIIDGEPSGYIIKLNELIRFAYIRNYDIIYIKQGKGFVYDAKKADGVLLHIA